MHIHADDSIFQCHLLNLQVQVLGRTDILALTVILITCEKKQVEKNPCVYSLENRVTTVRTRHRREFLYDGSGWKTRELHSSLRGGPFLILFMV